MTEPTDALPLVPLTLNVLLASAIEAGASDIHLVPGYPAVLRVHGDLLELAGGPLDADEVGPLLAPVTPPGTFDRGHDADFAFEVILRGRTARFRANVFRSAGRLAACLRVIPVTIPNFDWAGFSPELAERLAFVRDGLVVVTGPAGSGKTTTLAMLVNLLNRAGGHRVVTVEEPVEYRFPRAAGSVVTQREVGVDVPTFADGLRSGLRQDPDAILLGEIRDLETAQVAVTAAETGHRVFASLHSRDAKGAVTRLVDLFPQEAQRDVRAQLALGLRAVVSQRLLPGRERGSKRHLALEVLWNTHPIASAIRTGRIESIDNYLTTGREDGMITLDESIRRLLREGKITATVAEQNARDPAMLHR